MALGDAGFCDSGHRGSAVGGAAAGIGGKKVFESLKAKNINFKDVMDKVKQKLANTHSTTQTFKKKNMNVDDPKKAFWG